MSNFSNREEERIARVLPTHAKNVQGELLKFFNDNGLLGECYASKSRVKTTDDIIDKRLRKLEKKPNYSVINITDIIGMRFILLFKQSIPSFLEKLITKIDTASNDANSPFYEYKINEVIYYNTDYPDKTYVDKFQDLLKEKDVEVKEESSKENYSSLHIVFLLPSNDSLNASLNIDSDKSDYFMPLEIQIRTGFEDIWGEIDHKYGYSNRRSKKDEQLHPTLDKHLKTLKNFVDACINYADLIVEESKIQFKISDNAKILNVSDSKAISNLLNEHCKDKASIECFELLNNRKENAISDNDTVAISQVAEEFEELANSYAKNIAIDMDIFIFNVWANQALCYLASNNEKYLEKAILLYKKLVDIDKDNSVVLMRYGQSLGKAEQFDECVEVLQESFDKSQANTSTKFEVVEEDKQYVQKNAPKLIGYFIWRYIDTHINIIGDNEKLSKYITAYKYGIKGYTIISKEKGEITPYVNNLIYYAAEIFKIDKTNKEIDINLIKSFIEELEKIKPLKAIHLQTLINAEMFFDNKAKLVAYARELRNSIKERDMDFSADQALTYLFQAEDIIERYENL